MHCPTRQVHEIQTMMQKKNLVRLALETQYQTSTSICCCWNDSGKNGVRQGKSIKHSSPSVVLSNKSVGEFHTTSTSPSSQYDAKSEVRLGITIPNCYQRLLLMAVTMKGDEGNPFSIALQLWTSWLGDPALQFHRIPNLMQNLGTDLEAQTQTCISNCWSWDDGDNGVRQGLSIDHSHWEVSKSIWEFRTSTSPNSQ